MYNTDEQGRVLSWTLWQRFLRWGLSISALKICYIPSLVEVEKVVLDNKIITHGGHRTTHDDSRRNKQPLAIGHLGGSGGLWKPLFHYFDRQMYQKNCKDMLSKYETKIVFWYVLYNLIWRQVYYWVSFATKYVQASTYETSQTLEMYLKYDNNSKTQTFYCKFQHKLQPANDDRPLQSLMISPILNRDPVLMNTSSPCWTNTTAVPVTVPSVLLSG